MISVKLNFSYSFFKFFARDPEKPNLAKFIGPDGTPIAGQMYTDGDPYVCTFNPDSRKYNVKVGVFVILVFSVRDYGVYKHVGVGVSY